MRSNFSNQYLHLRWQELQRKCNQLSVIYEYIASNQKPKLSVIRRIRSKPIRHLLLQFDWLSLICGVLHRRTFTDDDEIQQLVLPQSLCESVLQALHDDNGHQGLQCMIDLLRAKVYWPSMLRRHRPLACTMWTVSYSKRRLYKA